MGWHFLVWIVAGLLAALWSLLCWTGHAVLSWQGWSQGLDWAAQVSRIEVPQSLADWLGSGGVETLRRLLIEVGPVIEGAVSWLPDLSGWITAIAWVMWSLGVLFLIVCAGFTSGLIALASRAAPAPLSPQRS